MSIGSSRPPRLSRRAFLRRGAWTGASFLGTGAGLSLFGERQYPRVQRRTLRFPGLPAGLTGLTLAQISDLHRSPLVSEDFLRRAAETVSGLGADVIVVTGDFVSDEARYAASCARALSGLAAPLGVYGVLGNHDHWTGDPEAVSSALTGAGMTVLSNRGLRLSRGGDSLWLGGVDDPWAARPDLDAALDGAPEGGFRVLLAHTPDYVDQLAGREIALQLSGHSHGGQVLLPGRVPLVTPHMGRRYPVGLRRAADGRTLVYTNVGLGVLAVPIRLNCPPEITLLTLLPGERAELAG